MAHESLSPGQKAELHRTRFEFGRKMAHRLSERSLSEGHDTIHGRETIGLESMRRAVWRAEYDALQADPREAFLPDDIRKTRGQGMSE